MTSFATRSSTILIEEEEYELNRLNQRFANYLDKIKDLGTIHLEFRRKIDSFHQNYLSNTPASKSLYSYQKDFHQLRQQLNFESKNLNYFQIRYEQAEQKNKYYQNQINRLSHDDSLANTQQQFHAFIEELNLLKEYYQIQEQEFKLCKNQYNDYLRKLIDYTTELDRIVWSRMQSEHDLCTLREQIAFEQNYNEILQQEFQYLDRIQSDIDNQTELKNMIEKIRLTFGKTKNEIRNLFFEIFSEDYRQYNEIQLNEYEYLYKIKFEMIEKNFEKKKNEIHSENINDLIEQNRQLQQQIQQYEFELEQIHNQKQLFAHLTNEITEYESSIENSRSNTIHLTSQIQTYRCLLTNLTQKPTMKIHFENNLIWVRI